MILRPFKQVDVFTAVPYLGNGLAVVLDGAGLSDAEMQNFARWTNLSETTFLLPPTAEAAGADYQVRIFAPGYEMPFARPPHFRQLPRLAASRWCAARSAAGGAAMQGRPGGDPAYAPCKRSRW